MQGNQVKRLLVAIAAVAIFTAGTVANPLAAGTEGTTPMTNPPANIPPSSSNWLTAFNSARASEGVGPIKMTVAKFNTLPNGRKAFVLINLERIGRGLPPFLFTVPALSSWANSGITTKKAPTPLTPALPDGGPTITQSAGVYTPAAPTAWANVYAMMYEGATKGWATRDAILTAFPATSVLSMGASATNEPAFAALFVSTATPPLTSNYTWALARTRLAIKTVPSAPFTLSVTPRTLSTVVKTATSFNVTLMSLIANPGPIRLTLVNGTTETFSEDPVTWPAGSGIGSEVTVTLNVPASAVPFTGHRTMTVIATGDGTAASEGVTLIIKPATSTGPPPPPTITSITQTTGHKVVINGTNFPVTITEVRIGTQTVPLTTVTRVSATQIVAVAPTISPSETVRVVTRQGTANKAVNLNYAAAP